MRYDEFAELYEKLEKTAKRLEKTEILSDFLRKLKKEEKNKELVYLLRGRVFADYDDREIGISSQLTIKAMSKATGVSEIEVNKLWRNEGDLGKVAELLVERKKQSTLYSRKLEAEKVLMNLRKLTEFTGKGTVDKKIGLIAELLTSASPIEARYIARTLLSDLRIGVGESVLRDAIVWCCFGRDLEKEEMKKIVESVQNAYDVATDFAVVFELACNGKDSLTGVELHAGKPVKVMLYPKAEDIEDAFRIVGRPAAIEFKYDGFRMMINKTEDGKIKIFTRRLENVTSQFPEVKKYVERYVKGKSFILDAEAVGFDPETKKYKPFQEISQRIKRKYEIEKLAKELPVEVNIFDVLLFEGKSMIKEGFGERRRLLERIVKGKRFELKLAEQIITGDNKKAEDFYKKALENGEEGVMAKSLTAPYKPGARIGYGVKVKPEGNELDLVITGGEYGTGKRAGWISSFDVSCQSDDNEFLEIGKVSTGLKEKEEEGLSFEEMTKILKPLIIEEKGRQVKVKPKIVVTVAYQNIQKSPTYSSGYALRFPRITRLRDDRSKDDIAFLSEVEKEYGTGG